MSDVLAGASVPNSDVKKVWLRTATAGFALMVIAMLVVLLVMVDKPHFGGLVGTWFLPVITSGVLVGGLLMLVASLGMRGWRTWRGLVLLLWSLIAVSSPMFGFLFLIPWSILAVSAPLVIWILMTMRRDAAAAISVSVAQ